MRKIIGIGNALVDVLVKLDDDAALRALQLPKGSMQLISEERFRELNARTAAVQAGMANGGACSNTMLALACLGAEPGFIGKIGDDAHGRFYAENARNAGVQTQLAVSDRHTGVASTFISPDGERTFATYLGAAALLTANDVTPALFQGYDILYVEGYLVQNHDLILKAMQTAKAGGLKVCIDLASYNVVAADLAFFRKLVCEYVDIVFANEEESAAFTAGREPDGALNDIAACCQVAVVKLGARGAVARRGAETVRAEACPVRTVVDTTAAGDFFAGGFLYGYARGCPLEQCLRLGTLLGAAVIQTVGTALTSAQWDEIRLNVRQILAYPPVNR